MYFLFNLFNCAYSHSSSDRSDDSVGSSRGCNFSQRTFKVFWLDTNHQNICCFCNVYIVFVYIATNVSCYVSTAFIAVIHVDVGGWSNTTLQQEIGTIQHKEKLNRQSRDAAKSHTQNINCYCFKEEIILLLTL
eukprot:m.102794 g.102794  ORF g.102794 m.102794 type:complete len:134 (+) comp12600_c0_seq15:1185-1586(+)